MGVLLTEKHGNLNYIKESGERDGRHYIGRLEGPGATFFKPTRNGRRYPLQLWRNVENSEDFKEGMETHTIFGEADHPADRADTSIKEIAVVLTDYNIDEESGILYVGFDILDTPNGRIIKELLDYGCKLGVSSRGVGDEIYEDGEPIIDPDTYIFYGFDVVVTPAVKIARPAVVENLNKSINDTLSTEIDNASTPAEIESMIRILESVNMPDLDSIKESLYDKLKTISKGDNISSKVQENLESLSNEVDRLKNEVKSLRDKDIANNIRIKDLRKRIKETSLNSSNLSKCLQESKLTIARLENDLLDSSNQVEDIQNMYEDRLKSKKNSSRQIIRSLREQLESKDSYIKTLNEKLDVLNETIESSSIAQSEMVENYESKISSMSNRILKLKESKTELSEKVTSLTESLEHTKSTKVITENKVMGENATLSKKLDNANKYARKATNEYLKVRCAQTGIKVETVVNLLPSKFSIKDVDKVVSELSDRKLRLDKVPVAILPRNAVLAETVDSTIDNSARQTMTFLESATPHKIKKEGYLNGN